MTLKEHIEEIDNLTEQIFKNYIAKSGANFQFTPPSERRSKIVERKYEWETW